MIVLKKGRNTDDGILFIDASQEFSKGKKQNKLESQHIEKILDAYKNRESVEKFAEMVDDEEVEKNGYNLNITRYVDISEDEVIIDLDEVKKEIQVIKTKIALVDEEISNLAGQLVEVDEIPICPATE